jgi:hypothetical protein
MNVTSTPVGVTGMEAAHAADGRQIGTLYHERDHTGDPLTWRGRTVHGTLAPVQGSDKAVVLRSLVLTYAVDEADLISRTLPRDGMVLVMYGTDWDLTGAGCYYAACPVIAGGCGYLGEHFTTPAEAGRDMADHAAAHRAGKG